MNVASCLSLFWVAVVMKVESACLGTCENEVQSNGACFDAFRIALTGGSIGDARDALVYGRYCGNNNQCDVLAANGTVPPGQEDSVCVPNANATTTTCPPAACDAVDEACRLQDVCLDNVNSSQVPERCPCDMELVIANAETVVAAAGTFTGFCDQSFYSVNLTDSGLAAIDFLQHEGVLMSSGFCCNILSPECEAHAVQNAYVEGYAVAESFCLDLVQDLEATAGINLCGASLGYPICNLCGSETQRATKLDTAIPLTEFTCGFLQENGLEGNLPVRVCDTARENMNLVRTVCGCEEVATMTMMPTDAPTGMPADDTNDTTPTTTMTPTSTPDVESPSSFSFHRFPPFALTCFGLVSFLGTMVLVALSLL